MKKTFISRFRGFVLAFIIAMTSISASAETHIGFNIGEKTEYGICIGYSDITINSSVNAINGKKDGNKTVYFKDVNGIRFKDTTHISTDTTAVYWLTGNKDLKFQIKIKDPKGSTFTDYNYANNYKKAHTFSSGAGTYEFTVSPYSGTGKGNRVYMRVYFFN